MKLVTITSQGQITIPAHLRRKFGFNQTQKVLVKEEEGKVVVEPAPGILQLSASLAEYGRKDKSSQEIKQMEQEAIEEARTEKFKNKASSQAAKLLEI